MKRTILITGGAGFIGSHVVRLFVTKYPDYRIVNLDKLTYAGNLANLRDIEDSPNYVFEKGDICDLDMLRTLFGQYDIDGVIHLAAESHVDRSVVDPESFVRTNVMGTTTLLDACKEYGIKRYHQVSTDEVYGDLPLDRPDLFFTEETPLHTSSPYSSSKASADLFVMAYHRTFGLPVTISRCSNNYGPYHFPEKLIPLMISRALADELARNGMQVTFALNVGQARSGNPDYLVTGQVDEAWLRETSATDLATNLRVNYVLANRQGRLLRESLSSSQSRTGLPSGAAAENLMLETLRDLVKPMAQKIVQTIQAKK